MKQGRSSWLLIAIGISTVAVVAQNDNQDALVAVSSANNAFSTELYDVLRQGSKDNLIVSPISVATVMAMLQNGARGQTATAIRQSLKFPPNDQQLNLGYQALLNQIKSDESFTLEMANKLYPAEGFKLNATFASNLRTYFGAEPEQLNYKDASTSAGKINQFVSSATKDRIKDLILPSDLDALTRLVLVNAIYFKGTWKTQFPKDETREMDFYIGENDTVKVNMMTLETDMQYGEIPELDAKCVVLPYKGDRLSMVILLPNSRTGLAEMETKLKSVSLRQILENVRERKVRLFLPRFKLESTIDLKDPLSKLGAGTIFTDQADLRGIPDGGKEQLFVSKAIQKAFIEVNEEGSEAAAATGVVVQTRAGSFALRIRVDHGFAGFVYDNKTMTQLFLTTVENPTVSKTEHRRLVADDRSHSAPTSSERPTTIEADGNSHPVQSSSGRATTTLATHLSLVTILLSCFSAHFLGQ